MTPDQIIDLGLDPADPSGKRHLFEAVYLEAPEARAYLFGVEYGGAFAEGEVIVLPVPVPRFTSDPMERGFEGRNYHYVAQATDGTGDVTLTVTTKPAWMTVTGTTNAINLTGTPVAGSYPVVIEATGAGGTSTQEFVILVSPPLPAGPATPDLFIAGNPVSYRVGTLRITYGLGQRTVCDVGVNGSIGDYEVGSVLTVEHAGVNAFEGSIEQIEETYEAPVTKLRISAVDLHSIADRRLITKEYEGKKAGEVVADIVSTILSQDAITAGTIEDGPLLTKASFRYVKVTEALAALSDAAGMIWRIDENRVLHFTSRDTYEAPWSINSDNPVGSLVLTRSRRGYRNRQIVAGKLDVDEPVIVTRQNTAEMALRAAQDGTSGIYEDFIQEGGDISLEDATTVAEAVLGAYMVFPEVIKFVTDRPGLRPGQTILIDLPERGIGGSYLITNVEATDRGDFNLRYQVQCTNGADETWAKWLKRFSSGRTNLVGPGITGVKHAGVIHPAAAYDMDDQSEPWADLSHIYDENTGTYARCNVNYDTNTINAIFSLPGSVMEARGLVFKLDVANSFSSDLTTDISVFNLYADGVLVGSKPVLDCINNSRRVVEITDPVWLEAIVGAKVLRVEMRLHLPSSTSYNIDIFDFSADIDYTHDNSGVWAETVTGSVIEATGYHYVNADMKLRVVTNDKQGLKQVQYQRSTNGTTWSNLGSPITDPANGFEYTRVETSAATYYYRAILTRLDGTTTVTTDALSVTIATAPATLESIGSVPEDSPFSIICNITAGGAVEKVVFQRSTDGSTWSNYHTDSSGPVYSYSRTESTPGTYYFRAKVYYESGLVFTTNVRTATVTDVTGPVGSVSASKSTIAIDSIITITCDATDNYSGVERVVFYEETPASIFRAEMVDENAPYQMTRMPSVLGTYRYYARMYDNAGNYRDTEIISVLVVARPTVDLTGYRDGLNPNVIKLTANVTSHFPITNYRWDMGDGRVFNTTSNTYTYNDPETRTRTVTITDSEGNTASDTLSV